MILAVFQRANPTAITEGMGITFSLYHESCWLAGEPDDSTSRPDPICAPIES